MFFAFATWYIAPWPETEPSPFALEDKVLTIGPSGILFSVFFVYKTFLILEHS